MQRLKATRTILRGMQTAVVSPSDLFAVGIGFDFAGAIVLAQGLHVSAREFARRIKMSRNTLAWTNVFRAEDSVDAILGMIALAFGFLVQAIAYVLVIGGSFTPTGGGLAYLVAALCAVVFGVSAYVAAKILHKPLLRRYLVEFAHYQRYPEGRSDSPDIQELADYGRVLGYEQRPEETSAMYINRVWKLQVPESE